MKETKLLLSAVCAGALIALANSAQAQIIYSTTYDGAQSLLGDIQIFGPAGAQSSFYDSQGNKNAQGIAINSAGNLLVSFYYGSTVNEYTPSGTFLGSFANTGTGLGDIALDSSGNLFTCSGGNVQKYSSTGASLGTFATLGGSQGLAFNTAGDLFVSDPNANNIQEFSPSGSLLQTISGGLNNPDGLAIDSVGNIFVANYNSGTISEFSSTGTSLGNFATGLNSPTDVAFDSSGNLYEADHGSTHINEYNSSGTLINTLTTADGSSPQYLTIQSVPEPSTLSLAGLGGFALLVLLRRRQTTLG